MHWTVLFLEPCETLKSKDGAFSESRQLFLQKVPS